MKKLIVSPSPHIHGSDSTKRLMRDVLIALIPAFAISVIVYGTSVVKVTAVAVISCLLFEYLIQRFLLGGKSTLGDYSACVTGVLLAFNLPSSIPVWLVILGSLVAIGVGKMSFGGLGRNPFNPALVGRVFLLISFPAQMTTWPQPGQLTSYFDAVTDASTAATPLSVMKMAVQGDTSRLAELPGTLSLFIGDIPGSLGEVSALALLIGFAFLLWRRIITWHIPIAIFATVFVFTGIMHLIDPAVYASPVAHLLTGGVMLGAIFMATDYVTSPMSHRGMLVYGVGIGFLTVVIRLFGSYPEGMSFAILIMNAFVPLINNYCKPKRFGEVKKK